MIEKMRTVISALWPEQEPDCFVAFASRKSRIRFAACLFPCPLVGEGGFDEKHRRRMRGSGPSIDRDRSPGLQLSMQSDLSHKGRGKLYALRQIDPTGKSLREIRNRFVQPLLKKYCAGAVGQITNRTSVVSRPQGGRWPTSLTLGAGCGGRESAARRAALMRTAKSCRPGIPTLVSS